MSHPQGGLAGPLRCVPAPFRPSLLMQQPPRASLMPAGFSSPPPGFSPTRPPHTTFARAWRPSPRLPCPALALPGLAWRQPGSSHDVVRANSGQARRVIAGARPGPSALESHDQLGSACRQAASPPKGAHARARVLCFACFAPCRLGGPRANCGCPPRPPPHLSLQSQPNVFCLRARRRHVAVCCRLLHSRVLLAPTRAYPTLVAAPRHLLQTCKLVHIANPCRGLARRTRARQSRKQRVTAEGEPWGGAGLKGMAGQRGSGRAPSILLVLAGLGPERSETCDSGVGCTALKPRGASGLPACSTTHGASHRCMAVGMRKDASATCRGHSATPPLGCTQQSGCSVAAGQVRGHKQQRDARGC